MKMTLVTKFRNRLLGLYALVAIATSIHAHAAPVVTEHGPYGEVGQAPNNTNAFVTGLHPVGIGDVLELPSTTRSIVSGRLKTEWGEGAEGILNDGLALNAAGAINYFENGSQLEFQLGAKIDMAQIDFFMYADWQRTSAWLDVHTSTDGGANWNLLHEVRQAESNDPPSVDRQYNVHSLTDPTGILASGINAIRFTFLGDGMGDNESGYVEIDVYGVEAPFVITEINYSPDDDMVTLTWTSRPGATYGVFMSTDLTDWSADLDDNVSADDDGETTTRTFDVLSDETELFFRVEEN